MDAEIKAGEASEKCLEEQLLKKEWRVMVKQWGRETYARSLCDGPRFNTKSITLQNAITVCLQIQISVISAVWTQSQEPLENEMLYVERMFENKEFFISCVRIALSFFLALSCNLPHRKEYIPLKLL